MTPREPKDPAAEWAQWRARCNGGNKRIYFVRRYLDGEGVTMQTLDASNGNIRRFGSYEAAKKVADGLNSKRDVRS